MFILFSDEGPFRKGDFVSMVHSAIYCLKRIEKLQKYLNFRSPRAKQEAWQFFMNQPPCLSKRLIHQKQPSLLLRSRRLVDKIWPLLRTISIKKLNIFPLKRRSCHILIISLGQIFNPSTTVHDGDCDGKLVGECVETSIFHRYFG